MMDLYSTYLNALNYPTVPVLFLDLDALNKNLDWVRNNAGNKKIRIATKSIRSVEILKLILKNDPLFQGLMTFDLREALWLKSLGFTDILMGYPTVDEISLNKLLEDPTGITLMVDRVEHLELLERLAKATNKTLHICLDMDLSMDLPGLRFGVYRSWVNSSDRLDLFLEKLNSTSHLKLTGLMGYEAQIAGVIDKGSRLIQSLKQISLRQLQKRRTLFVEKLRSAGHDLSFINGGGTGSLLDTSQEHTVTEVTVGSGLFCPVLFDHYKDFSLTPSLAFTLPIVRHPEADIFTCLGGGYIASGSIDPIKQPTPYLPKGATLLKHEGAGEVQTPINYKGKIKLQIGDSVIFRHAKAGEICERFNEITIIESGKNIKTVPTYRGMGKTFI
jgi:D-serine deaminase-like pyridoxal phosphate-dependent protein